MEIRNIKPSECKQAFAEPGKSNLIDLINPLTGRSCIENETLEQIQARYPGAEIVDVDQWLKQKAERQDTEIEWTETTEERYWEMLEVLPPAFMKGGGFLVGEPYDHHATTGRPRFAAFREIQGKYFEANRPLTVQEMRQQLGLSK